MCGANGRWEWTQSQRITQRVAAKEMRCEEMCRSSYYTPCIRYTWHRTSITTLFDNKLHCESVSHSLLFCQLRFHRNTNQNRKLNSRTRTTTATSQISEWQSNIAVSRFLAYFFFTRIRINCNMLLVLVLCYVLLFQWTANGGKERKTQGHKEIAKLDIATATEYVDATRLIKICPRKSFIIIIKYLRFSHFSLFLA